MPPSPRQSEKTESTTKLSTTTQIHSTDRAAVSLLFSLLVVERFVPFVLRLPGVLQDGAENGLKQQDSQIDDEEGIHGPGRKKAKLSTSLPGDYLHAQTRTRWAKSHFSTADRFWDLHL